MSRISVVKFCGHVRKCSKEIYIYSNCNYRSLKEILEFINIKVPNDWHWHQSIPAMYIRFLTENFWMYQYSNAQINRNLKNLFKFRFKQAFQIFSNRFCLCHSYWSWFFQTETRNTVFSLDNKIYTQSQVYYSY